MLDKTFTPAETEARLYAQWEESGLFKAGRRPAAKPFTIVIPPPNVTGSLHMGHALNNTIQDILVRFERMRGRDVLWQPGTDHAGIATQMVVERLLPAENKTDRRTWAASLPQARVGVEGGIGRHHLSQLRRLGASCDWSRERFTMDEGLSARRPQGLRPALQGGAHLQGQEAGQLGSEASDGDFRPEVEQVEIKGQLWQFKYPIEGEPDRVHHRRHHAARNHARRHRRGGASRDERYKRSSRQEVDHTVVGRRIPIIADEYSDPEKGTGAVKITPGHDFNDFEVGRRNELPRSMCSNSNSC